MIKILDYEISRNGFVNTKHELQKRLIENKLKNDERARKSARMRDKIFEQALVRSKAGIKDWQNATLTAESKISPNNTELIRVFKNIEVDLHLFALMQTIRLMVMANNFYIYTADGEKSEDLTALFKKKWFRKSVRFIVDSEFYGFSLIQFLDVKEGIFSDSELVPREYVLQQKGGVKQSLSNTVDLVYFDAPEYLNWLVPVGEKDNLGLLHKACPMVIKKKEVVSAWSESAEIFGMPFRMGKTDITDPEKRKNMEDMLENMGGAGWASVDKDDEIEFVETSKTDFYKIYYEFIQMANSELSKGFLLQTGTTDEKSFSGSANVHQDILKMLIEAFIQMVEEVTNESIIPACVRLGLLPVGAYFQSDNEQKLSLEEMVKVLDILLKSTTKEVPNDWIEATFGVPVETKEVETDPNQIAKAMQAGDNATVMNAVKNLYSGVLKSCNH